MDRAAPARLRRARAAGHSQRQGRGAVIDWLLVAHYVVRAAMVVSVLAAVFVPIWFFVLLVEGER